MAYGGLAAYLAMTWRRGNRRGLVLLAPVVVTALWAGLYVALSWVPALPLWLTPVADSARALSWTMLVLVSLRWMLQREEQPLLRDGLFVALIGLSAAAVLFSLPPVARLDVFSIPLSTIALFLMCVLGLLLVENLYRATRGTSRWVFKYLIAGAGTLFAFDLYFYAEVLLFGRLEPFSAMARPLVAVMVAPLLVVTAARVRRWSFDVTISRDAVLHTTALIGSGLYLVLVAGAGYVLRLADASWGPLLQIVILVGAGLVLVVLLMSGRLRARARRYISRNFFTLKYDYRAEWLRFIRTLSGIADDDHEVQQETLQQRAAHALADVVECSGGALFTRGRGGAFVRTANWNWSTAKRLLSLPAPFMELAESRLPIIDLSAEPQADEPARLAAARAATAGWLEQLDGEAWLLVPLVSADELVGVALLGKPRDRRPLGWEDRDLFEVLGPQVASYLREELATRRVSETQEFARLNRNFAFVIHDLKNLVSQLSLIVQQAKKHGDNPEFQKDAMETVAESVDKMRAMLVKLKERTDDKTETVAVDLAPVIRAVAVNRRLHMPNLDIGTVDEPLRCDVEPEAFETILANLIQNAFEAAGEKGRITIEARADGRDMACRVSDTGPGMSADFIQSGLFQPFRSTKSSGFGIGMFQCRELVEAWGGTLDVRSEPGEGTTMEVRLPLAGQTETPAGQTAPDMAAMTTAGT